jgi:MSHA pilin protein MshD
MSVRRLRRDQRGVTLIDLILVIVIIGLAVPPMMGLLIQSTQSSTFGITATRGNSLGSTLLEEIRSKAWDENGGAASATLGPESGETRSTYDDVDDFHGFNESPPKDSLGNAVTGFDGFRQQVSVCYVASTDLDTCLGSGTSNYKRITLTITEPEGRTSQIVTVISSF